MNVKTTKNKKKIPARPMPVWLRALFMAASILALITWGAEATTISKTNSTDGSADYNTLTRTVTFAEDVDFVAGAVIQDVNVTIDFEKISGACPTHDGGGAFNSEIFMRLKSPSDTEITLIKTVPNSTYTGNAYSSPVTVTFDDWAATTVGGPAPVSGTFKPVEALSAFYGETPLGDWTLSVGDNAPGDPLCFYEYTLTIDSAQPPVIENQTFSVVEQSVDGTSVGTVAATDSDAGDKLTYAITAGNDTGIFAIDNLTGEITVADGHQLDYETTASYDLTVRVTDSSGLSDTATITINVTDANEAPTDIALDSHSVLEHRPVGTIVGNFSTTDPEAGDSHTYSLVDSGSYPDNSSFAIDGAQLETAVEFDYDIKQTYSIKVQTDDGNGGTFSKEFTISITDGNDPPTDIALDSDTVTENQPSGTAVGNFSSTDNAGDSHTYTLVNGDGAADNASFQIVGAELRTNASFDYEIDSSYSIRVRSTDDGGLWREETFTITINDANDDPTDISLDSSSVTENQSTGTAVGNLSSTDQDTADSHTYSLIDTATYPDNTSFSIDGNQLKTAVSFDYEAKSSYTIRVQTDDGNGTFDKELIITINDSNDAPADLALDNNSVLEHQAVGTLVGNFSSTDPDSGDSHTYSLVDTATYPDNTSFAIDSGRLETAVEFDFDITQTYNIKVQTNDGNGGTFSKEFTISITDGNDPPTDIALDSSSVAENQIVGTAVGNLSSTDPNGSDSHTYSLVSGAGATDNASFQISGNVLQTNTIFDYEPPASYSIRVRSTDNGAGSLWFEKVFTITITDGNDAPSDIALDNSSVAENQIVGAAVGNFSSTDQDSGDSHTYSLVNTASYPDNDAFQINGSQLQTNAVFDREAKASYSIRIRSTDNGLGSLWFEEVFTITISNENEAPTDIALDSSSVNENRPAGTAVGSFSATDPDSGDSFTYSLAAGPGSTDNASFQISGSQLQTAAMFDHETKDTYAIRIQTSDSGSRTFEKAFTITINDMNDVPVGVADSDTIDEDHVLNVAAAGVLANDIDQDVGDVLSVMSADSASAQGASVNVAADGGFSYDPTAVTALQALNVAEVMTDTFTYMVIDGGVLFDTATVSIAVTGVNDAPTANDDAVLTVLETAVIVSPLSNDTDPDTTDTKRIASFTQGTHGTVMDSGSGTLTYTPAAGYTGSDTFTYTMEDSHSASDTATVNVTVNPQIYTVYLPAALNNYTSAPDLVITSLQASSDSVEIVIENQGGQATNSGFWVDFYVDPSPAPLAANELWPNVSAEGIAWGVTTAILPGQALTLIYSTAPSAPNLYYSAADSLFSGALPAGTPIYAQVDSAHVGHPNGAVDENHEIIGGVYNNIFSALATTGPASSSQAMPTTSPASNAPAGSAPSTVLPARR